VRRSLNACSLPTCIKSSRASSARPRQMASGSRPGGEFQHGSADRPSQARDREASPPLTPASTNLVHDYKLMSTRGTHQPTMPLANASFVGSSKQTLIPAPASLSKKWNLACSKANWIRMKVETWPSIGFARQFTHDNFPADLQFTASNGAAADLQNVANGKDADGRTAIPPRPHYKTKPIAGPRSQ
jgi:hypothetical protein